MLALSFPDKEFLVAMTTTSEINIISKKSAFEVKRNFIFILDV